MNIKLVGRINLLTLFIAIVSLFIASSLFSAEGGPCKDYGPCDEFQPELNNLESLQRGASIYLNYCYGCHSLQYSRWGRVANDLEIPEDIFIENLVLDRGVKMGDLMVGSMDKELSKEWFGVAPPDLTLVARKRTPEWVYTYLRAFYEDSSKTYGVNNLVYPGAAMPNVLAELQGRQRLTCKDIPIFAANGGEKRDESGNTLTEEKRGYLKVDANSGSLSVDEFDSFIFDLTNFLTYVGEPSRADRERIGTYTIFFFIIFTVLSSLLYREFQKDYH